MELLSASGAALLRKITRRAQATDGITSGTRPSYARQSPWPLSTYVVTMPPRRRTFICASRSVHQRYLPWIVMEYEEFHCVAVKGVSDRLLQLLRGAGVRAEQRVIHEIGRPEYVIAVHREDIDQAQRVFSTDLGPGPRTFTSGGGK
jgi:hypothetical protein